MQTIFVYSFLQLLFKKFEYPVGGDINYSAFIQAIDSGSSNIALLCTRDCRFQTTGKTFCPVIIYENLCFCVVSSWPSFKKATRKPRKNRETLRNKMAERRKNVSPDCAFTVNLSPPTTHERCVLSLTSHSISKADGLWEWAIGSLSFFEETWKSSFSVV